MASAFGGEPISPGWFKGDEVTMNEYRFFSLQYAASLLRSHSSPIDMPKKLRQYV
jgi:hypothetical protein